jgi:hypothetical protein
MKENLFYFTFFILRAIDMERIRQAALRRQLDAVTKAALVNSVKVKTNIFFIEQLIEKKIFV